MGAALKPRHPTLGRSVAASLTWEEHSVDTRPSSRSSGSHDKPAKPAHQPPLPRGPPFCHAQDRDRPPLGSSSILGGQTPRLHDSFTVRRQKRPLILSSSTTLFYRLRERKGLVQKSCTYKSPIENINFLLMLMSSLGLRVSESLNIPQQ